MQNEPALPVAEMRPALQRLAALAALLDNRFRIPGTNIRFGLDAIIGLIPYVGDIAGFLIAAYLMLHMVRLGAGPMLMLRILGNYLLDAAVGTIPFLGDIFDIGFKANRRNVDMLIQYYEKVPDPPRAVGSLFILFIGFSVLFAGVVVLGWWVLSTIFHGLLSL